MDNVELCQQCDCSNLWYDDNGEPRCGDFGDSEGSDYINEMGESCDIWIDNDLVVPPADDFADPLYARQDLLPLVTPQSVAVVGVGGVGYWVAKFFAMSGVRKLYLFDPDVIEESNRNRLDYPASFLGRNKAEACREIIRAIRPDCDIRCDGLATEINLALCGAHYLIDCTDNIKTQKDLYHICQTYRLEYLRAGYDGVGITSSETMPPSWTTDDEPEKPHVGYRTTPSWVVPAAVVAALTVGRVMYPLAHWEPTISLNINEIGKENKRAKAKEGRPEEVAASTGHLGTVDIDIAELARIERM